MSELRTLFSCTLHPHGGALLRGDGVAVGIVEGGAPAWDLLATTQQRAVGAAYHRLLLALDAPLDVYQLDLPPQLAAEIGLIKTRQARNGNAAQAAILGELADELADAAMGSGSGVKQVIWTVTVAPRGAGHPSGLAGLLRRAPAVPAGTGTSRHGAAELHALAEAHERARQLASALASLGSAAPPRLPRPEEICRLLYRVADPVRALHYELGGALLDRVCRVVTAGGPS